MGTFRLKHPFDGYPSSTGLIEQGLKVAGLVNPSMKQTSLGASTIVSLIAVSKVPIPAPLTSILTLEEIIDFGLKLLTSILVVGGNYNFKLKLPASINPCH